MQKVLVDSNYSVEYYLGTSLPELCTEYIDNDIPVILWATMEMREASYTTTWLTPDGDQVNWISPEHCLLLVGYDNEYYYFNDSRQGKQTAYRKNDVETAYESMLSQAVLIIPTE
ncbi:MAG: C39 family peptidase [Ruminococcus sp.]|nr:C39 family peptidase [Ruminococcus sp.]